MLTSYIAIVKTVSASEAKAKLLGLLDDVERGETVILTRHGRPVARLVPETDTRIEKAKRTFAELDKLRQTMPRLTVAEILSAIREGRE